MRTTLIRRAGDCTEDVDVECFSRASLMMLEEVTDDDLIIVDEDDATAVTVEHFRNGLTLVMLFNSDGEAISYVGHTANFIEQE